MRKHAAEDEGDSYAREEAEGVSRAFNANFENVYKCMGAQDQLEQAEEEAEEMQAPQKQTGIFGGLFSGFGGGAK